MIMTRLFVILCLQLIVYCLGLVKTPPITKNHCFLKASPSSLEHFQDGGNLEVVLFGIGDLRTDDHEGLKAAIENASRNKGSKILPIFILDPETFSKVPGAVAHTLDTVSMVVEALKNLQDNLKKMNLVLHYTSINGKTTSKQLLEILEPFSATSSTVGVHVCDLGDADNGMGYGSLGNIVHLPDNVNLFPWSCHLWDEPWANIEELPQQYTEFSTKYRSDPAQPINSREVSVDSDMGLVIDEFLGLPTHKDLSDCLQKTLALNEERCLAERNTGLFGTHWGGLDATSVVESKVLDSINIYISCGEDDKAFAEVPITCLRNSKSLEHATMAWNMRGDGGSVEKPEPNNMIAGERLTRMLLAPLLLGTLSPRRLWHSVKKTTPFSDNAIKTLVETREWHKLLAANNIRNNNAYQNQGDQKYNYFRWHGFLCRYLEADITKDSAANKDKEGIILIHGFGASASQWSKAINSLSKVKDSSDSNTSQVCLAPDLIGFGQSEKPPITYSGYLWEAYVSDFIKEIVSQKCDTFVIGGNSIGGFVSISAAANDASVQERAVSGCGSPGTAKCNGAILMNPAGVIQTKEEVIAIEAASGDTLLKSVAQVTATDLLPPCKPLPRPVARTFGTGLLWYLRPRIQEICTNLYPTNPSAVDYALCENILRDSLDPGAINVMISGSKLPMPRTYNEVIAADFGQSSDPSLPESTFTGPILMAQGILDPLNDAKGRSESLGALRKGIKIDQLQGGHCPHDEIPDQVATSIAKWMTETRSERMAMTLNQKSSMI